MNARNLHWALLMIAAVSLVCAPRGGAAETGHQTASVERAKNPGVITFRRGADGSIEVVDPTGTVKRVHRPGSLTVSGMTPENLERVQARREHDTERAQAYGERVAQRRQEETQAKEEAAAAKKTKEEEAAKVREQEAKAASARRMLDRRTGKYVMAIPEKPASAQAAAKSGSQTGKAAPSGDEPKPIRLWDPRAHRYRLATPLEQPPQ